MASKLQVFGSKALSWVKEHLYLIAISGTAVIAPIYSTMLTVGVLIFIDTISGILAAIKQKEKITSTKFKPCITKIILYNIAVISGYLVEHFLLKGVLPVTNLIAGVLGLSELLSVLENLNVLGNTTIFSSVIEKIKSKSDPS